MPRTLRVFTADDFQKFDAPVNDYWSLELTMENSDLESLEGMPAYKGMYKLVLNISEDRPGHKFMSLGLSIHCDVTRLEVSIRNQCETYSESEIESLLGGLENLPSLTHLTLVFDQCVTAISGIPKLAHLKELSVCAPSAVSFHGLPKIAPQEKLHLDLPSLRTFQNVEDQQPLLLHDPHKVELTCPLAALTELVCFHRVRLTVCLAEGDKDCDYNRLYFHHWFLVNGLCLLLRRRANGYTPAFLGALNRFVSEFHLSFSTFELQVDSGAAEQLTDLSFLPDSGFRWMNFRAHTLRGLPIQRQLESMSISLFIPPNGRLPELSTAIHSNASKLQVILLDDFSSFTGEAMETMLSGLSAFPNIVDLAIRSAFPVHSLTGLPVLAKLEKLKIDIPGYKFDGLPILPALTTVTLENIPATEEIRLKLESQPRLHWIPPEFYEHVSPFEGIRATLQRWRMKKVPVSVLVGDYYEPEYDYIKQHAEFDVPLSKVIFWDEKIPYKFQYGSYDVVGAENADEEKNKYIELSGAGVHKFIVCKDRAYLELEIFTHRSGQWAGLLNLYSGDSETRYAYLPSEEYSMCYWRKEFYFSMPEMCELIVGPDER